MVSGQRFALTLLLAGALASASGGAFAATKDVRTVVAQVGAEWTDEAKLKKLHEDLTSRMKDTPAFGDMLAKVKWVAVVDVSEAKRAWTIAARAEPVAEVRKGDIVELVYAEPLKAKSFEELPRVTKVICKAGTPEYQECRKSVKMGAFDASGARTSWGD